MKKIYVGFLLVLVSIALFADGVLPLGSGTETDPYQIATLDNLLWVSTNNSSWASHFIQTADIDASDTVNWSFEGFSPIGIYHPDSGADYFTGSYDGDGYTIDSIRIYSSIIFNTGLFGCTNNAIITNLNLTKADVWGNNLVGLLIGYSENSFITNCSVSGDVNGGWSIGGLIGESRTSSIYDCNSSVTIAYNSCTNAGGLVGASYYSSITQCSSDAVIENCTSAGGLVGNSNNSNINFCHFTGSITGSSNIGGIVGSGTNATLINCYNSGTIDLPSEAENYWSQGYGGIAGFYNGSIYNCQNYGNVNGARGVGGIVGMLVGEVSDCINNGETSGLWEVGGVAGSTLPESTIHNCTNTANLNCSNAVPGGIVGSYERDTTRNSFYNYDSVLLNGEHIYTVGAIGNNIYQDWVNTGYDELDVEDYFVFEHNFYLITSLEQLKLVSAFKNNIFRLMTDIDLSADPQFYIPSFKCSFDGNGHTISNFELTLPGLPYYGFFGVYDCEEGHLKSVTLENVSILGESFVGGLCGKSNGGFIRGCRVTGVVDGEQNVGGLIGYSNRSSFNNCYSRASVGNTLSQFTGGLFGTFEGSRLDHSYCTGLVQGSDSVGGLIGLQLAYEDYQGEVNNSFWDMETSGMNISDGGTGLTTLEMKTKSTFTDAGWGFVVGNYEAYWDMDGTTNDGYPFLVHEPVVTNEDSTNPEYNNISTLIGNYPNPFNPETTIKFSISKNSNVDLSIYNIKGQRIRTLANQQYAAGDYSIVWEGADDNGRSVGSGVYFYKLGVDGKLTSTRKCILMK